MTGFRLCTAVAGALLLAACASAPVEPASVSGGVYTHVEPEPVRARQDDARVTIRDEKGRVVVEKVPFRIGVSTFTVERMAKEAGCEPRVGAGLLTEAGPVEVYRVQCEDGRQYLAQCELRQCQALRR